jgi:hypothetical protein
MKIGTIVKVTGNSLLASEEVLGAFGVVMPAEIWWGWDLEDFAAEDSAVLFAYGSDVSEDLQGEPWFFCEDDLQPVSGSEDLPKDLFDRMNSSYKKLRAAHKALFRGAPAELSFSSKEGCSKDYTPEGSVQDLWKEFDNVMGEYNKRLIQVEDLLSGTSVLKEKAEAIVKRLKELQEI